MLRESSVSHFRLQSKETGEEKGPESDLKGWNHLFQKLSLGDGSYVRRKAGWDPLGDVWRAWDCGIQCSWRPWMHLWSLLPRIICSSKIDYLGRQATSTNFPLWLVADRRQMSKISWNLTGILFLQSRYSTEAYLPFVLTQVLSVSFLHWLESNLKILVICLVCKDTANRKWRTKQKSFSVPVHQILE